MKPLRIALLVLCVSSVPARADSIKLPADVLAAAWKTADCSIDLKEADGTGEALDLTGGLKLVEFYCWRAAY